MKNRQGTGAEGKEQTGNWSGAEGKEQTTHTHTHTWELELKV